MAISNPPPLKVPRALSNDPETKRFIDALIVGFHLLWKRTGGGTDIIADSDDRPYIPVVTPRREDESAPVFVTGSPREEPDSYWSLLHGMITGLSLKVRNYLVPAGLIGIWSGATSAIPTGWVICDGANGTPDLRNSFVIGAGSTYSVGTTGGATTYSLSVNTGATVATTQNNVDTQTVQSGSGISVASSGHTHTQNSHTHTVSDTINTMPPYYALAYIMKT